MAICLSKYATFKVIFKNVEQQYGGSAKRIFHFQFNDDNRRIAETMNITLYVVKS
jgi:hypothetical protein